MFIINKFILLTLLMTLLSACGSLTEPTIIPDINPVQHTSTTLFLTDTPQLPTKTFPLPSRTPPPPTNTLIPASHTPPQTTNTPIPASRTPPQPTNTPIPPTVASTPPEAPIPGTPYTRSADGMVMIYIPAGEFLMGSTAQDRDAAANEKPQHTVYLDAFWIDQTEVTVAQFRTFVQATGYRTLGEIKGWSYAYVESAQEWQSVNGADWQHPFGPQSTTEDNHPVVQVSWYDAVKFCTWVGGNLPDEAQWEKAARGTDGRIYPWGDTFDGSMVNFCDSRCVKGQADDDGYQFTAPVGSYPNAASPYGVLDMAGNVWEWTSNWYVDSYDENISKKNPNGPARVLRGGSWNHDRIGMRSAYRLEASPETRVDNFGFRCVFQAGN